MILFTILAIIAVILIVITIFVAAIGGTLGIVLFGDIIVCIAIIVWILKRILDKHSRF